MLLTTELLEAAVDKTLVGVELETVESGFVILFSTEVVVNCSSSVVFDVSVVVVRYSFDNVGCVVFLHVGLSNESLLVVQI